MRVVIPEFKNQSEVFKYLKDNKKSLMAQKCLAPIKSDDFEYGCTSLKAKDTKLIGKKVSKEIGTNGNLGDFEIEADAVANMAGWSDSYDDVLIPGCWDETIKVKGASGKQLIYHLKNHTYSTDAIIGGDVEMRSEWINLAQFNIEGSDLVQGQALIGKSIVKKKYDAKCFELYSDDEIKQHSIGLRYIRLYLCVNSEDEDYVMEKDNWDKYYPYVINKDKVNGKGYFWAVTEIKLLEYSAVLFGANELTTVLDTAKNIEPSEDTQTKEPSEDTLRKESLKFLLNT